MARFGVCQCLLCRAPTELVRDVLTNRAFLELIEWNYPMTDALTLIASLNSEQLRRPTNG